MTQQERIDLRSEPSRAPEFLLGAALSTFKRSFIYQAAFSAARTLRVRLRSIIFNRQLPREDRLNRAFDQQFGTDTAAEVPLSAAGVCAEDVERGFVVYRAVWSSEFHRAMRTLPIDHNNFTFLDYGSGKGKAMLMASDYPFRRILGIEYAPKLHEIASRNVAVYRSKSQRCFRFEPTLGDAISYTPPDEPLVCFFFNPFDDMTLARVFENIHESVKRQYRDVYILFVNLRSVRERRHFFDDLKSLVLIQRNRKFLLYKVPPSPHQYSSQRKISLRELVS
jgi:hypothetical protein